MKSELRNIIGIPSVPILQPDCLKNTDSHNYKVMVVDPDKSVQDLVKKALKYFSYNGSNFGVLAAPDLKAATEQCLENPSLILLILNRSAFVESEVSQFISYLKDALMNSVCRIVFKDELIVSRNLFDSSTAGTRGGFEDVRENMISYLCQVFVSYENKYVKASGRQLFPAPESGTVKKGTEKKIAKESNLNREKIYSVLAHDLKGPISSIKVLMDVLTSEPELLDKDTARDLLLNVRDTTSSIHEMLENFMFWVRVHKQDVQFSPMKISLNDIVNQSISLLKSAAFNKKIKLQSGIGANVFIFADEYMLNTVLRNLIYNALKFTQTGGEVAILVNEYENDVEVIIRDNGVGLSAADLSNILKGDLHFSKQGTDKEKGTGFGLLISKEFIEKNGGQLNIISREDLGSSFSFTVPKWKSMIAN
ncbi:MAG: hypothetical protein DRJ05_10925 [Bacteroidetes bacterium]|nr:MAG: hypothetical protein DRJ05_10925 [Bacteroidota bacterium]